MGQCLACVDPSESSAHDYHMGDISQALLRRFQLQEEMCTCNCSATAIFLKGMNAVWICPRLSSEQLEPLNKQSVEQSDPSKAQKLADQG